MDLKKDWIDFLWSIRRTETQLAKEIGQIPQGLNRKINNRSIKYTEIAEIAEIADIVEKYGYSVRIHKKEDRYKRRL